MTRRIGFLSGGLGSWAACKRDAERRGTDGLTLLFTDTLGENDDLHVFLAAGAANIGAPLVKIADGRTIWQLFRDERFLGNTRVDVCSKVLKRQMAESWLVANCDPADTVVLVGIGPHEAGRFHGDGHRQGMRRRWADLGWTAEAPLLDEPQLAPYEVRAWVEREGLDVPASYDDGFPHNNCLKTGCVKGGQAYWRHLLRKCPAVYAEAEKNEQEIRDHLGKDVSILRDRTGGKTLPLTLLDFRRRLVAGGDCDRFDFNDCSCFAGDD